MKKAAKAAALAKLRQMQDEAADGDSDEVDNMVEAICSQEPSLRWAELVSHWWLPCVAFCFALALSDADQDDEEEIVG